MFSLRGEGFELYAAIDLFRGRVARFVRGDPSNAQFYAGDPVFYANKWAGEGDDWLHIVDLDSAIGMGDNYVIIAEIVAGARIPTQVGGGIRSLEKAIRLIEMGVNRIVISSVLFTGKEKAVRIIDAVGGDKVMAALDFDERGYVKIRGWREETSMHLRDALEYVSRLGIENIMVTDIIRDGTLSGVNPVVLEKIPERYRERIVVAGGIANVDDVLKVRKLGFRGVILGKSIYENRINLASLSKLIKRE